MIFISKPGKNVRSQLAGIQRKMYKIVPAERQECSNETITKNRCKPSKKRLTAVIFGTPGWVRTSGLSLRRRPLYPTELRGLIQKIFNFTGLRDSNDSIFRRRSLYTTELQGHMQNYSIVQFRWTRDRRMLGGVCYIHLTKEACRCIVAQVFHTVKRALPRQEPGKGLDFYRSSRK